MPSLYIQPANNTGFEIVLDKVRTIIGRSLHSDICVNDPFASRVHAEIRRDGEKFFVTDLKSANGTYYNGTRLIGSSLLQIGDIVRIGETQIHFCGDLLNTNTANVLLSDIDLASSAEATIFGKRSKSNKGALLASVINEIAFRDEPGQKQVPLASVSKLEKQRNLLDIIGKVVEALLSEKSLDETLKVILGVVFDVIPAGRGYIFLVDAEGKLVLKGSQLRQDIDQSNINEVRISRSICDKVLAECVSVLTSDAQQDPRFAKSNSIVLSNVRSIMAVPLAVSDEVIGMIYVDNLYTTSRFTQEDLGILATVAAVAAVKIENTRLLETQLAKRRLDEELKVASEIQLRLHPVRSPLVEGYEVTGVSFPCREVGGDYYDFIKRQDGKWIFAVGDVSGKGIGAALMMSSLHAALHAQAQTNCLVENVVTAVNRYISENTPESKFLTLFCAELDPISGILSYVNAGHNPGLIVRSDKSIIELSANGLPVGVTTNISYEAEQVLISPGDILVIYSDGITEILNEREEQFSEFKLKEVICNNNSASVSQLRDRIDEAVSQFIGSMSPIDDMTMVIVKRLL